MIPRLSTTDRLIGWLACKAIKLLRVSDAEWHALCEHYEREETPCKPS